MAYIDEAALRAALAADDGEALGAMFLLLGREAFAAFARPGSNLDPGELIADIASQCWLSRHKWNSRRNTSAFSFFTRVARNKIYEMIRKRQCDLRLIANSAGLTRCTAIPDREPHIEHLR